MTLDSLSSSSKSPAYASKGIGGLMSGMDTESLVEKMLSGTQAKIDKQYNLKQQLTWKKEIYRDAINDINDLQSKYFSLTSKSSLRSWDTYRNLAMNSSSNAIKVSNKNSINEQQFKIQVAQLASSTTLKSSDVVSKSIEGQIDLDALKREVSFDLGGSTVNVDLSGAATNADIAQKLNDALSKADDTGYNVAVGDDGKLTFTRQSAGTDELRVVDGSTLGLQMTGLSVGATATDKDDPNNAGSTINTLVGTANSAAAPSINVTVNGVTKSITLSGNDYESVGKSLNEGLKKAFGSAVQADVNNTTGEIKFKTLDSNGNNLASRKVSISGSQAGLDLIGVKAGESNKVDVNAKLKDMKGFGVELQGDAFKFSINGEQFSFNGDTTLKQVMNTINGRTNAGVKISYSDVEDRFKIESTSTGAGFEINMQQTEGNLLSAMFGSDVVSGSGTVRSSALHTNSIASDSALASSDATFNTSSGSMSFNITVNGQKKTFQVQQDQVDPPTDPPTYVPLSKADIVSNLNNQLKDAYGTMSDGSAAISIAADGSLSVKNGAAVSFDGQPDLYPGGTLDTASRDAAVAAGDLNVILGFTGENAVSNATIPANATLADVGMGGLDGLTVTNSDGTTRTLNASDTLASLTGDGFQYDAANGTFTVSGNVSGANAAQKEALTKLFGSDSVTVGDGSMANVSGMSNFTAGTNAIFTVDGVQTESSTNQYTQDGIVVDFLKTTTTLDSSGNVVNNDDTAASVEAARDVSGIVDIFKNFVDDYNKLIDKLNKLTHADPTYKEYGPLTADQKKEMSEREIELWEEKAKGGLLRRDEAITKFLSQMRSTLYSKPAGMNFALYDIGIDTSSQARDYGKLEFDEAKLTEMLQTNPNDVAKLFADYDNGLGKKLNKILDDTAKKSSGNPGSLVQIAGADGLDAYESNHDIFDKIKSINRKIDSLNTSYQQQKTRYWRQFNAMEKALSDMSTQSSWLTNMV